MKKNMILAGLALLFAACSNNDSDINVNNTNELVPVKVHVSDFSVAQEDFPTTRAARVSKIIVASRRSLWLSTAVARRC